MAFCLLRSATPSLSESSPPCAMRSRSAASASACSAARSAICFASIVPHSSTVNVGSVCVGRNTAARISCRSVLSALPLMIRKLDGSPGARDGGAGRLRGESPAPPPAPDGAVCCKRSEASCTSCSSSAISELNRIDRDTAYSSSARHKSRRRSSSSSVLLSPGARCSLDGTSSAPERPRSATMRRMSACSCLYRAIFRTRGSGRRA
mmetsp:Transcript_14489/g.38729  ORF Transcript_14489/g.38729 Transcript_14489/m.38729 type:complete len:207 (-) Transcript_14489:423-1043(-)